MKFGRFFKYSLHAPWKDHYVNWDHLRNLVEECIARAKSENEEDINLVLSIPASPSSHGSASGVRSSHGDDNDDDDDEEDAVISRSSQRVRSASSPRLVLNGSEDDLLAYAGDRPAAGSRDDAAGNSDDLLEPLVSREVVSSAVIPLRKQKTEMQLAIQREKRATEARLYVRELVIQLRKVDRFFKKRLKTQVAALRRLVTEAKKHVERLEELKRKKKSSPSAGSSTTSRMQLLRIVKDHEKKFLLIYKNLLLLKEFATLNYTALRKLIKRFDKHLPAPEPPAATTRSQSASSEDTDDNASVASEVIPEPLLPYAPNLTLHKRWVEAPTGILDLPSGDDSKDSSDYLVGSHSFQSSGSSHPDRDHAASSRRHNAHHAKSTRSLLDVSDVRESGGPVRELGTILGRPLEYTSLTTVFTDDGVVQEFSFMSSSDLDNALVECEEAYAVLFSQGNIKAAVMKLHSPNLKVPYWDMFTLGLSVGITCCLFFCMWVLSDVAHVQHQQKIMAVFPVFRVSFCLVLFAWLWGILVYTWKSVELNHVYIFEFNPSSALDFYQIFKMAGVLSFLLTLMLFLYFAALHTHSGQLWGIHARVFMIIPLGGFLAFMLNPFNVFNRSSRYMLMSTVLHVMASPFSRVRFVHVYVGDVITSLVHPFADIQYTVCFYATGTYLQDPPDLTQCDNVKRLTLPLLMSLPYIWRGMQNLRCFYLRQKLFYLVNAGKYLSGVAVTVMGLLYGDFATHGFWDAGRVFWMLLFVFEVLYMYSWDVLMDWGLEPLRPAPNRGLRAELLYSRTWVYYFAIISNFFARFVWALTITPIPIVKDKDAHEWLILGLSVCEIVRRFQWSFFRVENEFISNQDKLRSIQTVPLPSSAYHYHKSSDDFANSPSQRLSPFMSPHSGRGSFKLQRHSFDYAERPPSSRSRHDDDSPHGRLGSSVPSSVPRRSPPNGGRYSAARPNNVTLSPGTSDLWLSGRKKPPKATMARQFMSPDRYGSPPLHPLQRGGSVPVLRVPPDASQTEQGHAGQTHSLVQPTSPSAGHHPRAVNGGDVVPPTLSKDIL